MSAPVTALCVDGIDVPFGDAPDGLRDVRFAVERGERLALVGASGVGKTTLLHVLSGSVRPSRGRVRIEGRDVTDLPVEARPAVLLPQTPLLFPHLSVFENVAFPLRVRGIGGGELDRRVEEALRGVRLEGFGPRRPATLSGGQARRVALARAVIARPPVLLLDEPLSALDPRLRQEIRSDILGVQAEYRPALVVVTHDLEEASRIGDRIGVLIDGSLAQLGTPESIFRAPATLEVARFVGLPNELVGEVGADRRLYVGDTALDVEARAPRAGTPCPPGACQGPVTIVFGPDGATLEPAPAGGLDGDGILLGRVEAVRHYPAGATAVVFCGIHEIEVRVPAEGSPAPGARVGVRLGGGSVHVFPR